MRELEAELERQKLSAEVEMLRAIERVREQERQHLQEWAKDIKEVEKCRRERPSWRQRGPRGSGALPHLLVEALLE